MTLLAKSTLTRTRNSRRAGEEASRALQQSFLDGPKLVFVYQTVNHDQEEFLLGLQSGLPVGVAVLGCSGQGVIGRGEVREEGYAASVMALGGDSLGVATGCSRNIQIDTRQKGAELGRSLRMASPVPPRLAIVHYDPLSGVDISVFLDGFYAELGCAVIGGAAAHVFTTEMTTTYQYFGSEVLTQGAVAVALWGDFTAEMGFSTGCSPVGYKMTATRCEDNTILELDGRPALEVWREITGARGENDVLSTSALAIGVPSDDDPARQLVRAAFVLDEQRKGILVQAAIPSGTELILHHRTVNDVLEGTRALATDLKRRLQDRPVRAAICFECGARTKPFLGTEATSQENEDLQTVLGPDAEWAGVVVWGEVFPVGQRPGFHNYTYPMVVFCD